MTGVREMTLVEELRALDIEESVKERIIKKFWEEIENNRIRVNSLREESYKKESEYEKALENKDVVISVLVEHIRIKELL